MLSMLPSMTASQSLVHVLGLPALMLGSSLAGILDTSGIPAKDINEEVSLQVGLHMLNCWRHILVLDHVCFSHLLETH